MQKSLKKIQQGLTGISYTIRSYRRSRRVRIAVHGDGSVVVTKPARVSVANVESFVREKREWIKHAIGEFKKKPQKILAHYSARDFVENKERARIIVKERVREINQYYNFEIKNITIRNQKSRWGSCSGKKNLSFNYKIIFLPEELRDYIIVHEICHLKEMNHSKRFWSLVAEQVPDYKARQKKIKLY